MRMPELSRAFNDRDPATPRIRRRGGRQSVSIVLEAGRRYALRYRDGARNWFDDGSVDWSEDNGLGDANGVINLNVPR